MLFVAGLSMMQVMMYVAPSYLAAEDEPLEILGRYRFSLGEREIDLTEAIEGKASAYPL